MKYLGISIPDRWLQGRTLMLRRENPFATEKELLEMAVSDWLRQMELASLK